MPLVIHETSSQLVTRSRLTYKLIMLLLFTIHTLFITLAWLVGLKVKNLGCIDFAWPLGFTVAALVIVYSGPYVSVRSITLMSLYVLCGLRFMFGWSRRTISHGEDRRYRLWRERWINGQGWFKIKSVKINSFFFFQAQSITTVFILSFPLFLVAQSPKSTLGPWEISAIVIWLLSFALENVADLQLHAFKANKQNKGLVLQTGLWKFSRHPNYFFELCIWITYGLYVIPNLHGVWDGLRLLLLPLVAYWFLIHFTGVPMTEKSSLQRRGDHYKRYQQNTNRLLPWFPSRP